ncbi:MAG: transcriptional repressor [Ignavibacteriales bacterium]|nr:transcriptional repressor [Ignavibacteriales bacterium]MBK7978642.1 transcriptional repressor [Ignavibacteriota bacterium]
MEFQKKIDLFIEKCRTNGLSVTPQRLAIYKALVKDKTHPKPETVHKNILGEFPTISLATVYKTLETFEEKGIISVVTPLHETVRYEAEIENHHHIVCVRCKKILDVHDPELNELKVPEILSGHSFINYNIQFNVICDDCKN